MSHPGHGDLFSCCQRKNFKGAPYSFFAIHITAALVLFMTDGMTVSLRSEGALIKLESGDGEGKEEHPGSLETSHVLQSTWKFKLNKSPGEDCLQFVHSPVRLWPSVPAICFHFC